MKTGRGSTIEIETLRRTRISLAKTGKKRPPFSLEWRKKMALSKKGNQNSKGKSNNFLRQFNLDRRRELHPNWKGGITPLNALARKTPEYKVWREAVFKRDNYTCQDCGQIGGTLNADHIKPFSQFPEERLNIDNGITLCKNCHLKTETYAGRLQVSKQQKLL